MAGQATIVPPQPLPPTNPTTKPTTNPRISQSNFMTVLAKTFK